jgi:adhesin/invasin
VDVTFAPGYPGLHFGAVVLYNSAKAPIATAYTEGIGTGPQVAFLPGAPTTIVNTALYQPKNMVVDPAGNLFVANAPKCQILEFSPPSYTVTATISTLLSGSCFSPTNGGEPRGVTVDGAGNVYAITSDTGTVLKAQLKSDGTYAATTAILTSITLDTPSSVVADGSGNLFITDSFTRLTASHNRILMAVLQAGGGYTVNTIATTGAVSQPWGLAVDSAGNVFYSDIGLNTVVKLASPAWTSTQVAGGLLGPYGLAVDAAGDVYIADTNNGTGNQLVEASPNPGGGSYTQMVVTGTLSVSNIRGIGLDLQGNIYVVDQVVNKVNDVTDVGKIFKLDRADAPTLTFPDTPFGSTSPAQDVTVQNIGNTQLTISQITLSNATLGGADTTCTTGGELLNSAATCVLGIEFSPSSVGPNLPGTVTLTDNTLNNNGSTQTIDVSGNGVKANQTITFTTAAPTGAALGAMFPVAATSNSGLPVTLTVDAASSSVCTISGGTVTITSGSGTCIIDANQAGNANYNAATQVQSSTAAQTGPAAQISFTTQPSNTTAGAAISPAVVVKVTDAGGTPLNGAAVTLTLPGGVTLHGTVTATTNASGLATFSGLSINTAGTYTLVAASGSASGTSNSFIISAATSPVVITAFQGDGQQATINTVYGSALQALVKDSFGNVVSGVSVTFTAPASGASATFSGTATVITNASGIATSPAMTANAQAGPFQIAATAPGAASPATFTLTNLNVVKTSQTITFTTPGPATAAYGAIFPVAATSSSGLPVTLTVDPSSASVCTISGGLVTIISAAGICTIDANQAGDANYNPATQLQSSTIAQTGAAAQVVFTTQPSNAMAGAPISVVVKVTDLGGNPLNGAPVTLMLQGGAATLNGTVTATTNASGLATFTGLSINTAGTYTLLATSGSASGLSNSFIISAATSPVVITAYQGDGQQALTGLAFSGPLQALVQDSFGNAVIGVSVTFTAPASGPSGTFSGTATVTTNGSGVAVSPALTANADAGPFQVLATVPGAALPATFGLNNIANSPPATQLAFVQQPTDTTAGQDVTPAVTVQLLDTSGNPSIQQAYLSPYDPVRFCRRTTCSRVIPPSLRTRTAWRPSPI